MLVLATLLFSVLGALVFVASTYLCVLSVLAKRAVQGGDGPTPRLRFDIVIPAHDEEAGIAATIASLKALDYPKHLYRILVVADNCSDGTAGVAAEAGALVLERRDVRRGKGHALSYAFDRVQEDGIADAVVVIDADSTASPGLLRAFARRIEAGAGAVQATYGVRNPDASWRTRLMTIALALFHVLRSLARERLGLSSGLRGNGMGFSLEVLRRVPHDATSIVEDLEYGIKLGEAGYRVHYAWESGVLGDMPTLGRTSESQRRRWEQGRSALARAHGWRLLREGLKRRDGIVLDLAVDLLLPPLTWLVLVAAAGTAAAVAWHRALGIPAIAVFPWILSSGFLALYVLRGLSLSGTGLRGVLALFWAPIYMAWKVGLLLTRFRHDGVTWVRTAREDARP